MLPNVDEGNRREFGKESRNEEEEREEDELRGCGDAEEFYAVGLAVNERDECEVGEEAEGEPKGDGAACLRFGDARHIHEVEGEVTEERVQHQVGKFEQEQPAPDLAPLEGGEGGAESVEDDAKGQDGRGPRGVGEDAAKGKEFAMKRGGDSAV